MTTTVIVQVPVGAGYQAEVEINDPFSNHVPALRYAKPGDTLTVYVYGSNQATVREVSLN